MISATISVIQQIGLLTLFVVAFVYIRHFSSPLAKSSLRNIYLGVLFGILIAVAMLNPIVISEGAVFDPRSGPAILSGVLAGPVGALIAGAIGAFVRYFIVGGPIAPSGAAGFAFYAAFSIVAGLLIKRRNIPLTPLTFALLGLAGAVSVIPAFFIGIEPETAIAVLRKGGAIFLANNILSTLIVGIFIVQGSKLLSYSQRLEAEIRENTKLARIAHVTTNAVIITDGKGYTEWVNPAFERVTGYSAEEIIGKKPGALLQGPDTDPATVTKMSEQIAQGKGFRVEVLNYTKDQRPYWLRIDCEPYEDVDGSRKFMAIEVDITKRKAFEETLARKQHELELALNNLSGALVYTDADLNVVLCSDRMKDIYDVPAELLSPGAHYPDLMHHLAERGDYGEGSIDELVEPRIASLRRPTNQMFMDRLPDGKIYGVRRTAAPSGGTITVVSDITEQVLLNERLEEAIVAAEQASRAKSEFLATMSHEIRTPMTGILGFADLLLDDELDADAKSKVEKIKNSASSLLSILNDILDLSKLDAGKLEIERINFSPARIANEVAYMFHQTCPPAKKPNLTISARIADNLPAAVCTDPTRLRQVLVNLVGNAVKFTDSGSVTLHCEKLADHDVLKFRVVDTGLGITASAQKHIFDDFVQADASISREYQGTGLGLSICKRLVEMLDGEIGLESEEGKGSTFWFTLPFEPVEGDIVLPEETGTSRQQRFVSTRSLSILVAEDNEINQTIIQAMLSRMGHRCTIAENGLEAVEAVRKADYDLILMDVRMPELSGPDATRKIRQMPDDKAQIPIIALTADVLEENRKTYFEAGMIDCIPKPINQEQLALAINKAVGESINRAPTNETEAEVDDTSEYSLDLDEVTTRLGLPAEMVMPLLQKFADKYAGIAGEFETLFTAENYQDAKELAHSFKGASASLGMPALSECAQRIEIAAKASDAEEAGLSISVLEKLMKGAVRSIRTHSGETG
jgi:PAS domain S-box-containing protein